MFFHNKTINHFTPFFTVLFLVFFCRCASKQYTIANLPDKRIEFGSGGGVTGKVDTYTLLQNGQLFATNSLTKETRELEGISAEKAENFFQKVNKPEFRELQFEHPGNLYYFIDLRKEGVNHRVVWGSSDHAVPERIQLLYRELRDNLKKKNP